ncbi:aminoacylase-1A-like protein [Syncephalis fuscata]|nr:aminoacylase-1A-like protein [Syncephalis fuscata]KAI9598107.1 aminoacylase-1A-like protein [Syncephalis fuscata]
MPAAKSDVDQSASDATAVKNFQDYIRIRTEQPNPDYKSAMTFLKQLADEITLSFKTVEPVANKPVAILTWTGTDASLPSIMLNSHTDVVPVFKDQWTHDPFAAERVRQDNGDYKIFGRGTQDMKVVGISYIEALRRLKQDGWQPRRTLHLTYVPDEELGGATGMAVFCKTKEFNDLNIGVALDEAGTSIYNVHNVMYGERAPWPFTVKATGATGHGSKFIKNTAAKKLMGIANELLKFSDEQEKLLNNGSHNGKLHISDVSSINLTMLKGGIQFNVVPSEMEATFDLRVTPKTDTKKLSKWLDDLAVKYNVTITYKHGRIEPVLMPLDDKNVWWNIIQNTYKDLDIAPRPIIGIGATDARYLRAIGIPAFGISMLPNTPKLSHSNNEFAYESVYLKAITKYKALIKNLAA